MSTYDSPYHDNYPFADNIKLSPVGKLIAITKNSKALESTLSTTTYNQSIFNK